MRLKNLQWGTVPLVAALIAAWIFASYQFPETMHQVRLVLLLIATGGPGD